MHSIRWCQKKTHPALYLFSAALHNFIYVVYRRQQTFWGIVCDKSPAQQAHCAGCYEYLLCLRTILAFHLALHHQISNGFNEEVESILISRRKRGEGEVTCVVSVCWHSRATRHTEELCAATSGPGLALQPQHPAQQYIKKEVLVQCIFAFLVKSKQFEGFPPRHSWHP